MTLMTTTASTAAVVTHPFRVELWKGQRYLRTRKFRTKDAAFTFVSDWLDEHDHPHCTLTFGPGLPAHGTTWNGSSAF